MHSLVYFTGGTTAAYSITSRRWTDLLPAHSPPPVLGGSLAYDPFIVGSCCSAGATLPNRPMTDDWQVTPELGYSIPNRTTGAN